MRPPPFLIGATLLFWGWQTDLLIPGAIMAVVLEIGRWSKARWEFSDQDFSRIWIFCCLLFLAAGVYAFTSHEGPSEMIGFFQNPNFFTSRKAGNATSRSAAALFRWLPMLYFLFVAAQAYSSREGIPLETISLIMGRRWRRARKLGLTLPPSRSIDVSYPYFGLCLFAASVHTSEDATFFWGLCALLAWVLWTRRSPRFHPLVWASVLGVAVGLGYLGQRGVGRLQNYLNNFNPPWLSNFGHRRFDAFQSRTHLGQLGRLKTSSQIVIRVERRQGPVPERLREATYRLYKPPFWIADISEKNFDNVPSDTNGTAWVLVPGKTNTATVNIGCYLDGGKALLPLPWESGRLQNLPAYILQKSPLGSVLAEGPGLVVFDADHGPGPSLDSPGNTNEDLSVPPSEQAALKQVADQLHLDGQTAAQATRTLGTYFQEHFTYSTWQPLGRRFNTNETSLARFLLHTHKGHCEFFATAGVLLLRQAHIPARYAVGYAVHEGAAGKFVVRQRDAHAWCLVWDQAARSWQEFDPTPASWMEIEGQRNSSFQFFSDAWSRLGYEISKFRWGQSHVRQYVLWALVPILALLLYQIIFRKRSRSRRPGTDDADRALVWPGLDSEFYVLEKQLADQGLVRRPEEPISEWLKRALQEPQLASLRQPLEELLRLHYRYRFDPQGLLPEEREALRQAARQCLRQTVLH